MTKPFLKVMIVRRGHQTGTARDEFQPEAELDVGTSAIGTTRQANMSHGESGAHGSPGGGQWFFRAMRVWYACTRLGLWMQLTTLSGEKVMNILLDLNHLRRLVFWLAASIAAPVTQAAPPVNSAARSPAAATAQVERGRYLIVVGGCNDCHTPGYGSSGGKVAEQDWLVGDMLGFSGPWGTTYPTNLRQLVAQMTEAQWLVRSGQTQMRPPMPWVSLHGMTQDDLKAIYRYIAWLGPKGEPAPTYLPPGSSPKGPVVAFPGG